MFVCSVSKEERNMMLESLERLNSLEELKLAFIDGHINDSKRSKIELTLNRDIKEANQQLNALWMTLRKQYNLNIKDYPELRLDFEKNSIVK